MPPSQTGVRAAVIGPRGFLEPREVEVGAAHVAAAEPLVVADQHDPASLDLVDRVGYDSFWPAARSDEAERLERGASVSASDDVGEQSPEPDALLDQPSAKLFSPGGFKAHHQRTHVLGQKHIASQR